MGQIFKMFARSIIYLWILVLLYLPAWLFGQTPPDWTSPNPSMFTHSATVVAEVNIDGVPGVNADDELAFFSDDELRGYGNLVETDSGNVFFTTVYFNQVPSAISARLYRPGYDEILIEFEEMVVTPYTVKGSFDSPVGLNFFSDNDAPIEIMDISLQFTLQNLPFPDLKLEPFLISIDGDPVEWSALDNPNLNVQVDGDILTAIPEQDFTGTTQLTIVATELTSNAKSDSVVVDFKVEEGYPGPVFDVVPGQGIVRGSAFTDLCDKENPVMRNLGDFQTQSDSCIVYSYYPVVQNVWPDTSTPDWQVESSFPNSMTIVASAQFTPMHTFSNSDDLMVALIDGEVRGVTTPVKLGENYVFFLNVGGQVGAGEIELKFYHHETGQIMSSPEPFDYKAYEILGASDNPVDIDFSPLLPDISESGDISLLVRDTSWTGEMQFVFRAEDCTFPEFLFDSTLVSYCVVEDSTLLTYYYLIGDERGFDENTLFTRSCSAPEGYVEILDFNCSHNVVMDAEEACAVPVPDLREAIEMIPGCDASQSSEGLNLLQIPAPNSSLIQIADTIHVFLYDPMPDGNTEFCSILLILENFGKEVRLDCPPLLQVDAIPGECNAFVDFEVDFTQGCDSINVDNDFNNGGELGSDLFPIGATEVNFSLYEKGKMADSCEVTVLVKDVEVPDIVCPDDLLVELYQGDCVATGLDLGDASATMSCGQVTIENDAGNEFLPGNTEVLWTATAYNDSSSTCIQTIEVQDIHPPSLNCPADTTILPSAGQCNAFGYEPTGLSASAICGDVELVYEIPHSLNYGPNVIEYEAIGSNGLSASCVQSVTVEGELNIEITCPGSVVVELDSGECQVTDIHLEEAVVTDNCSTVVLTNDAPAAFSPGITHVTHTATATDGTVESCQQEVEVIDSHLPLLSCPSDTVLIADHDICGVSSPELEDPEVFMQCGPVELIDNVPTFLPVGVSVIDHTATAYNGESTDCTYSITVIDQQPPSAICQDTLEITIPFGEDEWFVEVQLLEYWDNCLVDTVYNSQSENGADASGFYSPGQAAVVFFVEDVHGNSATCETIVHVISAAQELDTFFISGQFSTPAGYPVQGVEVGGQGVSQMDISNSEGLYEIMVLESQSPVVTPEKNDDWLNGVSTLDLILIQGHILNINPLPNPYTIIAGDANRDGILSTFDLILLQNLILGIVNEIPGGVSWRFVPSDYSFVNPESPLAEAFPENKVYPWLSGDFIDEDWVAIKTGDASGQAAASGTREVAGNHPVNLISKYHDNGIATLSFYLPSEEIFGFQLEIFVNPDMAQIIDFSAKSSQLPNFSIENFHRKDDKGVIRTNWWLPTVFLPAPNEPVFKLEVELVDRDVELRSIVSLNPPDPRFDSEVYCENKQSKKAFLSWKYDHSGEEYVLYQNEPNPFSNTTVVPFKVPEAMPVEINIFDSMGKLIRQIDHQADKGMNHFYLNKPMLHSGVYYFQLKTGEWTGVIKMVIR